MMDSVTAAARAKVDVPRDDEVTRRAYAELEQANAELTKANAELTKANASLERTVAELETFAGVVSHDLKSPLTTIAGYVQLLTHLDPGHRFSAEYDEFLAKLGEGVGAMSTLIDDLLAFATAPQAQLRLAEVDLDALVREVVAARTDLVRHNGAGRPLPDIRVDALPAVFADRSMLRQVIDNLVGNAIKYTSPGAPAFVRVTAEVDPSGWAHIEVVDRGIGIPDGKHDAVFASFNRAHWDAGYPGNGLGLTICRLIVERHGGVIGARPNPGGGTRFWLTLPAAEVTAVASPGQVPAVGAPVQG
jgi:signal transduction histidine kinase